MGCHSLLQGIFPTQGSNLHLLHWQMDSLPLNHLGNPRFYHACVHAKWLQSYPILCKPMHCNLPGSSVHGILQARILEWVAMPSCRGSSQLRDQTRVSYVSFIGRQVLANPPTRAICPLPGHHPPLLPTPQTDSLNSSFPRYIQLGCWIPVPWTSPTPPPPPLNPWEWASSG